MNSKFTLRLLAAVATIGGVGLAAAQVPSGLFRYEFAADSGVPLYNFSGSYPAPFLSSNAVLALYHHAKGQLAGSEGPFSAEYPNVEVMGSVNGSVRDAGTNLAVRLTGRVWIGLRPIGDDYLDEIGVQRKDKMSLVMGIGAGTLSGTDRTTATTEKITYTYSFGGFRRHVVKLFTSSYEQPISIGRLPENDGRWALDLNMVPNASKLSGTASITFPNNQQFKFDLVGNYLPETGKVKVLLKGSGEDKGARLTLALAGADMSIESMRGNVGGQRVRLP